MKKTISIFAALAISAAAVAQSVNPTVQVTNDYKTRMGEAKKLGTEIFVPDSLYDFDYDFDYSVFDSPYKGAYEFSPYAVKFNPEPSKSEQGKFYLRAGAGYALHPELDLVWTPVSKENFSMSIFGNGTGFWGSYSVLDSYLKPLSDKFTGYDFDDNAGIEGRVDYKSGEVTFEFGHDGVFASSHPYSYHESGTSSMYNSGYGKVRVKSSDGSKTFFLYDVGARFRYGKDAFSQGNCSVDESDLLLDLSLGPVLQQKYKILIDAKMEMNKINGGITDNTTFINLNPHVAFNLGAFALDAGVNIDRVNTFHFAPDVTASVSIGQKHQVTIYGEVSGGDMMNTYHDFKQNNHRFNSSYGEVQYSRTKLKGVVGIKGFASSHFQFDISGGYGMFSNTAMDSVFIGFRNDYQEDLALAEAITYKDHHMAFADMKLIWHSERFDALGSLLFRKMYFSEAVDVFALPMLSGSLDMRYNANRRLFFGVSIDGQMKRECTSGTGLAIPGFIDLGVSAEYKFATHLSLWAKGGNLLFQPVRKSLLYVDKSPYVTAGIALRF